MKTLKINGLFGHKSYEIDLSDRCLVLIGENGSGKSTILKMIKALSELNFVELSKFRFNSIEYSDGSSFFKIELSDIMPNGEMDLALEGIDLTETISIEDVDPNCIPRFADEFDREFINTCRKQIPPNHFSWILSCVFHGKNLDKSDLALLENARKYAFEQSAFYSMVEKSFTWIDQIDVIKLLKDEIKATEFNTDSHGLFSTDFDIQLFEKSRLYYGKFDLQSNVVDPTNNDDDMDEEDSYFFTQVVPILPNDRFTDVINRILKIKSLMNLGSCLLIDMTSQFNLVNNPCHESSTKDDPSLEYLNLLDTNASKLGVGAFCLEDSALSSEIRKLHINVYSKCINNLGRFNKMNSDNTGRFAELPERRFLSVFGIKEPILNRFFRNEQINVSELISRSFFNSSTKMEINASLFEKYVNALKLDKVYSVNTDHEMFSVLSKFFFEKYDELKDWFKPIIKKNSVFDFDYDKLRFKSKEIEKIKNEWDRSIKEMMGEDEDQPTASISSFNFIHVLFYDFYNNEFKKFKSRHTTIVDNFSKVLSKFLFTKKIAISPAGVRILNQSGVEIEPKNLSSGERKILVLILISMFVKDVTLLLDEPEISISVIWQGMLLPTLLSDTSIDKIMVATQSPFLIDDENMIKYLQALN